MTRNRILLIHVITIAVTIGCQSDNEQVAAARGGATYTRLQFSAGPSGQVVLRTAVDFGQSFSAPSPALWEAEYCRFVQIEPEVCKQRTTASAERNLVDHFPLEDWPAASQVFNAPSSLWPAEFYERTF